MVDTPPVADLAGLGHVHLVVADHERAARFYSQAFGLKEDSGWFRISVGAVSNEDIEAALPRVRAVLASP